jgi:hypothetical protein
VKNPIQPFICRPPGLLVALMVAGSMFMLHAATTPATNAPPIAPLRDAGSLTSGASAGPALPATPVPALTNGAPAAAAAAAAAHGVHIEIDNDDDSTDDARPHGHTKIGDGNYVGVALEAVLIPIIAIIATFATPVLIVFFVCYFKFRRRKENLVLAQEYLNKGLPVPPQLLDESQGTVDYSASSDSPNRCKSDVRRGFKLGFIGLGVTLALFVSSPHSTTWAWGLIPLVMGIGYLISGWVESKQRADGFDSRAIPPSRGGPL